VEPNIQRARSCHDAPSRQNPTEDSSFRILPLGLPVCLSSSGVYSARLRCVRGTAGTKGEGRAERDRRAVPAPQNVVARLGPELPGSKVSQGFQEQAPMLDLAAAEADYY
jgi:hypothetical protein